ESMFENGLRDPLQITQMRRPRLQPGDTHRSDRLSLFRVHAQVIKRTYTKSAHHLATGNPVWDGHNNSSPRATALGESVSRMESIAPQRAGLCTSSLVSTNSPVFFS